MIFRPLRARTDQRSTRATSKAPDPVAASEGEEGHPHRCRAGHRWQHTGPTAEECPLGRVSSHSDLPDTRPQDCPLCTGREDLLLRPRHAHHCVLCEGDWEHEGRCIEGFFAWCPWCFPEPRARPAPGMRSGAHKHYCPECSRNWEHSRPCSAPLRAVLPECAGCRERQPVTHVDTVRREPRARRASQSRRRGRRVLRAGVVLGSGLLFALASFQLLPLFPRHGSQVRSLTSSDNPEVVPQPSSESPPSAPNPRVTSHAGEPDIARDLSKNEPPADQQASSHASASPRPPAKEPPPATSAFRAAAESRGPTDPPATTESGTTGEPRATTESRIVGESPRPSASRAETPRARRDVTRPVRPSVAGWLAVDRCAMPSVPSIAVSAESGTVLGLLVGTRWMSGDCAYVIRRPDGSFWGLAAVRVRIQPLPGSR